MRIVVASSYVPFVDGGGRFIVEWLKQKLIECGHEVEHFFLPFIDQPEDLLDQMVSFRLMDLSDHCDLLIALRPPAHLMPHANKVLWFIHHIRSLYDLWNSPYDIYTLVPDDPGGRALRKTVIDLDTRAMREAKRIFTNSKVVAERLRQFNGVSGSVLYPPLFAPERFRSDGYGEEIVCICRIEFHKRQWLLVQAMRYVKTDVKLRLCGASMTAAQIDTIHDAIAEHRLHDKIAFEDRWISEEEKIERLASALAVAYLPQNEDSYGYCSLEAAHACKAVLTATDSGGVLELITDGRNGIVVPPDPHALADAMDRLYLDREKAARLGEANKLALSQLGIEWPTVVEALTA
jgi:glycosyltransferase involved in cell wall biosynthesis